MSSIIQTLLAARSEKGRSAAARRNAVSITDTLARTSFHVGNVGNVITDNADNTDNTDINLCPVNVSVMGVTAVSSSSGAWRRSRWMRP
jgi:hypothetical protein